MGWLHHGISFAVVLCTIVVVMASVLAEPEAVLLSLFSEFVVSLRLDSDVPVIYEGDDVSSDAVTPV